jgi:hypothetical protein
LTRPFLCTAVPNRINFMSDYWKTLDPRTLPGHLARRLQQLAVALFTEEVAGLGLTPVQYSALHAICKQPGIDQKTLAQTISYDAATIGGVIDQAARTLVDLRTPRIYAADVLADRSQRGT